MITRNKVLSQAVDACMEELYSFVYPRIKWKDFIEECKIYSKDYKEWEAYNAIYNNRKKNPEKWEETRIKYESLEWEGKTITECIGPKPFEFYYLPKEIMKDICDSYIDAYQIDSQQGLLNTIQILKNYCKEPIVDKWIEGENGDPGHRGYEHPDNLEKEINIILTKAVSCFGKNNPEWIEGPEYDTGAGIKLKPATEISSLSTELQDKFFEFLDKAGNFYNWNRDLNSFNMSVYLGASPNSNKEAVIKNWKEYRNQDIIIDEEQIKKEYYGEEDFD